jgi:hypothetical protein
MKNKSHFRVSDLRFAVFRVRARISGASVHLGWQHH